MVICKLNVFLWYLLKKFKENNLCKINWLFYFFSTINSTTIIFRIVNLNDCLIKCTIVIKLCTALNKKSTANSL